MAISVVDSQGNVNNTSGDITFSNITVQHGDIFFCQFVYAAYNAGFVNITFNSSGTLQTLDSPNRVGNSGEAVGFFLLSGLDAGTYDLVMESNGTASAGIWTLLRGADPASWSLDEAYEASPGPSTKSFVATPVTGGILIGGMSNAGQVFIGVSTGVSGGYYTTDGGVNGFGRTGWQLGDNTSKTLTFTRANTAGWRGVTFLFEPSVEGGWIYQY